jgi:hypothetical protein
MWPENGSLNHYTILPLDLFSRVMANGLRGHMCRHLLPKGTNQIYAINSPEENVILGWWSGSSAKAPVKQV